jgi:hypothetical protein
VRCGILPLPHHFPRVVGHPVRSFFAQALFLRWRCRSYLVCCKPVHPPSLWGVFVLGMGGVFSRAHPASRMFPAPVRGALGFPIPACGVVFLPCPDRALFPPPFWGVFIFCGFPHRRVCYLSGMGKRNRGGCPVVSAKNAVKAETGCFILAFARAPLRVKLGVFAGFLLHGGEVWLMLWPLLWA